MACGEARIVFEHAEAQAHFGAGIFWVRVATLQNEEQAIADWGLKREGTQRGLAEVTGG